MQCRKVVVGVVVVVKGGGGNVSPFHCADVCEYYKEALHNVKRASR